MVVIGLTEVKLMHLGVPKLPAKVYINPARGVYFEHIKFRVLVHFDRLAAARVKTKISNVIMHATSRLTASSSQQ